MDILKRPRIQSTFMNPRIRKELSNSFKLSFYQMIIRSNYQIIIRYEKLTLGVFLATGASSALGPAA